MKWAAIALGFLVPLNFVCGLDGVSDGALSGGVTTNGHVTSGNFSAIVPLHSSLGDNGVRAGHLLYLEPYGDWFDHGELQTGAALGFRHLFSDLPAGEPLPKGLGFLGEGFYVGGDVSLDVADVSDDMRFWQVGVGAEIGTRYFELSGRYQFPLGDGETSEQTSRRHINETTDTRLADGSTLRVESRFTITDTLTLLTESMAGWQIDGTLLVPGVDDWVDLRLLGGYASFHAGSNDDIERSTWRFGAEVRPVPSVIFGATYYDNEMFVEGHWLYSVGFELPFELKEIGDGKGGFWTRIKNSFKPQRRSLMDRMVEPGRKQRMVMQVVSTPVKVESQIKGTARATVILPDGRVVVVDRVSGSGSATWTGSSSQTGLVMMSGTITLSDSSGSLGATVLVNPSATLTANQEIGVTKLGAGSSLILTNESGTSSGVSSGSTIYTSTNAVLTASFSNVGSLGTIFTPGSGSSQNPGSGSTSTNP